MKQFQFIILLLCFFNSNSMENINNQIFNIHSLNTIASRISIMFKGIIYDNRFFHRDSEKRMADAMGTIVHQIALLDAPLIDLNFLDDVSDGKRASVNFEDIKHVVLQLVTVIDEEYGRFIDTFTALKKGNASIEALKPPNYPDLMTLNDHLQTMVTFDDPTDNSTFLFQVSERLKKANTIRCNDHLPPLQYVMYEIVFFLVSSQLKAFAIYILDSQFKFLIDKSLDTEKLETKIAYQLTGVQRGLLKSNTIMKSWVAFANQEMKNCVPKLLIRDVNFIEMERVFQQIAVHEFGLMNKNSCSGQCSDIKGHMYGKKNCYQGVCTSCEGVLKDCQNKLDISYCALYIQGSRRYEWIETALETPRLHGLGIEMDKRLQSLYCPQGNFQLLLSDQNNRVKGTCDHCMCTCEENTHYSKKSTFVISSQIVRADVNKDKVITGVRFVKKNRIIYTQIKQGRLSPGGRIDQKTNHWKPIEPLDREKVDAQIEEKIMFKNRTFYDDFIVITSEINNINLNDLYCPWYGYVLTGVGLRMSETPENENQISLFIDCHSVDFKKARIFTDHSTGLKEDSRPHGIKVETGGLPPDRIHDETYNRDLVDGYYVKIGMSNFEKDGGQTVIPWFDSQDVTSNPGLPLSGIGLHYKSGNDSGGFLQYELLSINYFHLM